MTQKDKAQIIGFLRKKATYGERRFLEALRKLPAEFAGWIELPVGDSPSDFVLLHPKLGLFILEVKDCKKILVSNVDRVKIRRTDGSEYWDRNPVREVREKAEDAADALRGRWELRDSNEQLIVPWTYAVAFPNLSARTLQRHKALSRYLERRPCVISRNDLQSPKKLERLLGEMAFQRRGFKGLTDRQIKAVQAALHKETVVVDEGEELSVVDAEQQEAALQGIYEELRSETSEEGDAAAQTYRLRLVRGVAGSGKTLVLGLRAYYLHQRHPEWDILVLTRNYLLANSLRRRLQPLRPKVQVWHWHAFARYLLQKADPPINVEEYRGSTAGIVVQALERLNHPHELANLTPEYLAQEMEWIKDVVSLNPRTLQIQREDYINADRTGRVRGLSRQVQRPAVFNLFQIYQSILRDVLRCYDYHDHALLLQRAILLGMLSPDRFDAVLVDEAQDFAPAWFTVIKQLLRGDSVFMTADPAQRVFGCFSWRKLDFEVVGRSRILKRPYRNTYEVFITAHEFAGRNPLLLKQLVREGTALLEPEIIPDRMRHGPWPIIKPYPSFDKELAQVEREVRRLQAKRDSQTDKQRYKLHDIAVLLPTKKTVDKARTFFSNRGFRVNTPEVSEEDAEASLLVKDHLNLTNLQRIRGLEFKVVFICQLQALPPRLSPHLDPQEKEDKFVERTRWLYVGMTRARDALYMSHQGPPPPEIQVLMQVLEEQRASSRK